LWQLCYTALTRAYAKSAENKNALSYLEVATHTRTLVFPAPVLSKIKCIHFERIKRTAGRNAQVL